MTWVILTRPMFQRLDQGGDIIRNTLCITEDTHDDDMTNFVNVTDIYVCSSLLCSTDLKDLFVVEAIE